MTAPGQSLRRTLGFWERQGPWLTALVLVTAAAGALLALSHVGALEHLGEAFGRNLRGYTTIGLALGGVGTALVLLSLLYSLRRRSLQERFPILRGTMVGWLWVHVYGGLLALIVATLHAGMALLSPTLSSGTVLYWALFAVGLSGLLWRRIYARVPLEAAPRVGNYSEETSRDRAHQQLVEIEKRAAGSSPALHAAKEWLLQARRSTTEAAEQRARLQGDNQATFDALWVLAKSRDRALERLHLQDYYQRRLHRLRVLHVPLGIALVLLLGVHVVGALDVIPKNVAPRHTYRLASALSGVHDSRDCASCHNAIYRQWSSSMHAHALSTAMMVAQTNQVAREELLGALAPDPKNLCVNCHAPFGGAGTGSNTLPLAGKQRGVGCTDCHQFAGPTHPGGGALESAMLRALRPGDVMYGPFARAVGNAFHESRRANVFGQVDEQLICRNCHDVHLDRNGDGRIQNGHDLVLQSTFEEYLYYRKQGGSLCLDCHMPPTGETRAAETAAIPLRQDRPAPPREVRDHSFVGVDYPMHRPGSADPNRARRVALLSRAASLRLESPKLDVKKRRLTVTAAITNVGAGHSLPTGFAFARQLWVELTVVGQKGELFASGKLGSNVADLCDGTLLGDPGPMKSHVIGCGGVDKHLVNLQQRLVDHTVPRLDTNGSPVLDYRGEVVPAPAPGATEQRIQRVLGGAVSRERPVDGARLSPLAPGETRRFVYDVPLSARARSVTVQARLLFRNIPPYLLRALAAGQPSGERPRVADELPNLDIVELTVARAKVKD